MGGEDMTSHDTFVGRLCGYIFTERPEPLANLKVVVSAFMLVVSGFFISGCAHDLSVASLEVNQSVQYLGNPANADNSLTLVRGRRTTVRMNVGVSGAGSVAGVDGQLQVFKDGIAITGSPFSAENGPITAPLSPDREETHHTLNFEFEIPGLGFVGPDTSDVKLIATVDPAGTITEPDETNNSMTLDHLSFECRRSPSIAYVPINYTFAEPDPANMGLPSVVKMLPGIGDDFIWHTYPIPDPPNYYAAAVPPINLATDVDASIATLLTDLEATRVLLFPQPDYIYGWIPGNPIAGNGWAAGIGSGNAAFGNTQDSPNRYQRTFAHEIGHLLGLSHNSLLLDPEVGFDGGFSGLEVTATDDCDPAGVQGTKCRALKDFMYAGQLTTAAWIAPTTYDFIAGHSLTQNAGCAFTLPPLQIEEVLLIQGQFVRPGCEIVDCCPGCPGPGILEEIYELSAPMVLTRENPKGTRRIELRNAEGELLFGQNFEVSFETSDSEKLANVAPFTLVVPKIAHVDQVVLLSDGKEIARQVRSPNAPVIQLLSPKQGETLADRKVVKWEASDKDGEKMVFSLQYSPDEGKSFVPLAVNLTGQEFVLDPSHIPGSRGQTGFIRLIATDGLNTVTTEVTALLIPRKKPEVQILKPVSSVTGESATIRQGTSLILVGQGYDKEDGPLPEASLEWSIDGKRSGNGRVLSVDTKTLSVGEHKIILTGMDQDQNEARTTGTIIIRGQTPGRK
jgi:hypothetical protein